MHNDLQEHPSDPDLMNAHTCPALLNILFFQKTSLAVKSFQSFSWKKKNPSDDFIFFTSKEKAKPFFMKDFLLGLAREAQSGISLQVCGTVTDTTLV